MGWAKKACFFLAYFASQRPSLGYVPFPAKAPDANLETTSSPTKESSKVLSTLVKLGLPVTATVVSCLAAPVALAGASPVAVASLVMSNIVAVGLPFVLPDGDEKETTTAAVLQREDDNSVWGRAGALVWVRLFFAISAVLLSVVVSVYLGVVRLAQSVARTVGGVTEGDRVGGTSGGGEERRVGRVRSASMTTSGSLGFQSNAVRRRTLSAGQMHPGRGGPDGGEAFRNLLADATISTMKKDCTLQVKSSSITVSGSHRSGAMPQAGADQDLGAWLSDGVSVSAAVPAARSTSPGSTSSRRFRGGRSASTACTTHPGEKPGRNEAESRARLSPARMQEGRGAAGAGIVGASTALAVSASASQVEAVPAVTSTQQAATATATATATTTGTAGGLIPSRKVTPPASTTLPTIGLVSGAAGGGDGCGNNEVVGCDDSKDASVARVGATAASTWSNEDQIREEEHMINAMIFWDNMRAEWKSEQQNGRRERWDQVECEPNRKMTPEELAADRLETKRKREEYRQRIRRAYSPVVSPTVGEGGAAHATPPLGSGNEKGAAAPPGVAAPAPAQTKKRPQR